MPHLWLAQRLVVLFVVGLVLLNYPLIDVWRSAVWPHTVPAFPVLLLLIWAGLIAALAWLMERSTPH